MDWRSSTGLMSPSFLRDQSDALVLFHKHFNTPFDEFNRAPLVHYTAKCFKDGVSDVEITFQYTSVFEQNGSLVF